ncbi:hypothetical protein JKP88DRAFT_283088 [Tribonema minus]|uniref:MYND-type domain-containing protein n=1 Tax=Tribonema minus TaxID=303371 RepID=A0A835YI78_9STRA|nr:hypothetical protein JKP88DRAFT_283088 [Tribonema minus]
MTSGADPIECLERVELAPDAQLGRVLQATREIAAGDIVLCEGPLVLYASYADLTRQVKMMPAERIAELLDLFVDQNSARLSLQQARTVAVGAVREAGGGIDMDIATRFVLLGLAQGLAMPAASVPYGGVAHHLSCLPNEWQERRGFLRLAGWTAPSCAPNCMRSVRATPHYMTLVATRAIAAGETITRETVKLADTTRARREETLLRRGYACACARCGAPDVGFGLPCPASAAERCCGTLAPLLLASLRPSKPGSRACTALHKGELAAWTWQCSRCALQLRGDAVLPRLAPVEVASRRLEALNAAMQSGAIKLSLHAPLTALIADARRQLCATHIIVRSALGSLATLYATAAANCNDMAVTRLSDEDGSVITSRARVHALAAKTEMDALRVLECTVAGCDRGAECDAVHPSMKDGVPYALNALKSLQHASIAAAAVPPGANAAATAAPADAAATAVAATAPAAAAAAAVATAAPAAAAAAAAIAAARCPRLVPHLRRYVPVVATMLGPQSDEAQEMAAALGVLPGGDAPLYCANCCAVPAARGAAAAVAAAVTALKSCGRCHCVRYCGAACQRAHYAGHHKRVCKRFAALAGGGGAGGAAPVDFSGMSGEGDAALRVVR